VTISSRHPCIHCRKEKQQHQDSGKCLFEASTYAPGKFTLSAESVLVWEKPELARLEYSYTFFQRPDTQVIDLVLKEKTA